MTVMLHVITRDSKLFDEWIIDGVEIECCGDFDIDTSFVPTTPRLFPFSDKWFDTPCKGDPWQYVGWTWVENILSVSFARKMRNTLVKYVMVGDAYASLGQCRRLHHSIKDENVKSITGETKMPSPWWTWTVNKVWIDRAIFSCCRSDG